MYSECQVVSRFLNITIKDGLPSNYVFAADEDEHGFLWLGTDKGLARYDGFRWQTFTTDEGLPGNYINQLYCDGNGGIWLYFATKGLYHFSISTGKLNLVVKQVSPAYISKDSTGNLFYFLLPAAQSNTITGWYASGKDPAHPQLIYEFPADMLWGFAADPNNKALQLVRCKNASQKTPEVRTLSTEWKVDIAAGIINEPGFYKMVAPGIIANTTTLYYLGAATFKIQLFKSNNAYLNAVQAAEGIWVNNERDGLYFIDHARQKTHFTEADGLSNNMVTGMHILKNGRLLATTLGAGIMYKLAPGNAIINTVGKQIKGFALEDREIYAASPGGVFVLDADLRQAPVFVPTKEKNVQDVNVWDKQVYVSHLAGFTKYSANGNMLALQQTYPWGAGISNVVKAGDRLFAGSFGNGVVQVKNDKLVMDDSSPAVTERLQAIPNGYASLSREDGVALCFNDGSKLSLTTREGLPSNTVYHVHAYNDTFWISTKGGVAVFSKNKLLHTITPGNGFKGSQSMYSFHDTTGSYWIVSDGYLSKYSPDKNKRFAAAVIKHTAHNIPFPCIYDPVTHTLLTGGFDKIFITSLHSLTQQNFLTQPGLQQTMADGKYVDENFSLPSNYSNLVFYFKPASSNPFSKTQILYRLEGSPEGFKELKDSLTLSLVALRSGTYTLIAKSVNEFGNETPEVIVSRFTISPPFWQSPWALLLLVASGVVLTYLILKQRQQRKQAIFSKEKSLLMQMANERDRISKELHDNLGSSLTTIIAQTDNVETKLMQHKTNEALEKVQQLSAQSRETMNILRETIWAVQEPEHELEAFVNRTRDFLHRTYAVTNIECSLESTGTLSSALSPGQTLHLFRSLQEITQNIIKHSSATNAGYFFTAQHHNLEIRVRDNGKGFDATRSFTSNGLKNLDARMQAINGKVSVSSQPEDGTEILLIMTL